MNNVQVLDCTLRDGGYCNDWCFGKENIKKITTNLSNANIDIVECGFITNRESYNPDKTLFSSVDNVVPFIPDNRKGKLFVCMMNYGDYDVSDLPFCKKTGIDGIRVAFHKKNYPEAIEVCRAVKEKGYKVFVQPMVSLSYTDEEFLDLISKVNELNPYAFYIVDSFGQMKRNELFRLLYIVEHNLKGEIKIGFHSHNNMQLAYSNAQCLLDFHMKRDLIIDSSVYGMGRGAGNLNTELFVEFLNDNANGNYDLKPLLEIIDDTLNRFYQNSYWGYSLPNYLSAFYGAHPNYARYFDDKNTLTVQNINDIFEMMDNERKVSYDKEYAEQMYLAYMEAGIAQEEHSAEFDKNIAGKTVLIIAPGKSLRETESEIKKKMREDGIISVCVNAECQFADTDYIFVSNIRRYRELKKTSEAKCIVTSNISSTEAYLKVKYGNLLNDVDAVRDNAGLMVINLLIQHKAKKILLAGFDGYSYDEKENYANNQATFIMRDTVIDTMNAGMRKMLKEYGKMIDIEFITPSLYE